MILAASLRERAWLPTLVIVVTLVGLVVTVLLAASCGGNDDTSSASGGFASMLGQVPASMVTTEGAVLQYVDMDLAWDRLGLADAPAEDRLDSLAKTTEPETFTVLPRLFDRSAGLVDEARSEIGFSVVDVIREIAVDSAPNVLRIAATSVTASEVDTALRADPVWSDRLGEIESDHGSYFDWSDGDDLAVDIDRVTVMRPVGVGGQVSLLGDDQVTFVRTHTSELMESALAVIDGDGTSAADDDAMSAALDVIGDADVIQLVAVHEPTVVGADGRTTPGELEQRAATTPFVDTYDALVVAELTSGDEIRTEILVIHGDDDAAAANVELVERQLAEGVALTGQPLREILPGTTVTKDGPVVRITMTEPGAFSRAFRALLARDLMTTG